VISYFIETEIDVFDVDCVALECLTKNDKRSVVDPVCEVVFIVTLDLDVNRIIFIVGLLEVGTEGFMSLNISLLAHFTVLSQKLGLD